MRLDGRVSVDAFINNPVLMATDGFEMLDVQRGDADYDSLYPIPNEEDAIHDPCHIHLHYPSHRSVASQVRKYATMSVAKLEAEVVAEGSKA
ncbi:hypothetical protein HY212_06500 [Candidatus Pacearchaeota archaeon]|nr:hypothetical protein [Candidatus Pacearchaeota archaeon]